MVNLSTNAKNAACDAVTALVNTGGKLVIYDANNNVLARFTWTNKAVFGSAANGEATATAPDANPVEALRDGIASQWKLLDPTDIAVMWGVVGQRYKIISLSGTNPTTVVVGGDRTSIFTKRSVVTLVNKLDQTQNKVVYVDNQDPVYNSGTGQTTITLFESVTGTFHYIHLGFLGLDNIDIKEGQPVQLTNFRYIVLG